MNLHQAIRDALGLAPFVAPCGALTAYRTALASNPKSIVFGEDVETGVFRCTLGLMEEFGTAAHSSSR